MRAVLALAAVACALALGACGDTLQDRPIGHNALPAPLSPTDNVQMVSTQPELPVRCCTIHAPAIRTDSDSAMATSASRYKLAMRNPANSFRHRGFMKYAVT